MQVGSMAEAAARKGNFHYSPVRMELFFCQLEVTKEQMTHKYTSPLAASGALLYLVQLLCALIPCADEEVRHKHVDRGQQGY